jgi:hypothetical protein
VKNVFLCGMKPLEIAYTDREITPWAGLILSQIGH